MVLALGRQRPDEYFPALGRALREAAIKGPIVLDMLLCNGAQRQRYFTAEISPYGDIGSVRHIDKVSDLCVHSSACLLKHIDRLDMSLLSDEQRAAVRMAAPVPGYTSSSNFPE